MKKFFILLSMLLCACQSVSENNYEQKLEPWIGRSRAELYRKWGEPERQFNVDFDTYVVTYLRENKHPIDGDTHPYRNILNYQALAGPRYGYSQYPSLYYCQTSFTLRRDVIIDYSFNGDDCV